MSYPILYPATEANKHFLGIAGVAVAGLSVAGDTTADGSHFATQGLGVLSSAISVEVTEERNGSYELTMRYPVSGVHFSEIAQRCLLVVKPNYTDDPQPFRIYRITKPLNGICTIYAQHISYDMSGFELPGGYTASGVTDACSLLSLYSRGFTVRTTMSGSATFKTDVPASVRSWMGGKEGSLIDLYGGEWHWDGTECVLSTARGSNRGVTIRYGKNLTSLTQDEQCANVYTALRAYWRNADGDTAASDLISTGITLDTPRIYILDASMQFQEKPTTAQLNTYGQSYVTSNNLSVPAINLELNFVQLQGLSERVDLCDTVTIQFEKLGVSATAKCVKTVWDALKERYTKTVFGDARGNLADTVAGLKGQIIQSSMDATRSAVQQSKSAMEIAVDDATARITGNAGGYVIMHDGDDDGYPDELLVMNTDNINTATKVWRWNKNGLGYSSTGYNGTFGLAMTANGAIVADYITTGTLTGLTINNGNGTFYVTSSGALTASDATIRGAITATSLTLVNGAKIPASAVDGIPSEISMAVLKDGTIGTPQEGSTGFVVSSAGLLQAANAIIYGSLYSSNGTIGGWILADGYMYRNTPVTTGTASTQYGTLLYANENANANSMAIRVRQREYNGSSYGNWSNKFYVRYDGHMFAGDATIVGDITATSGSFTGTIESVLGHIGGWTIGSDSIYSNPSSSRFVALSNGTNVTGDVIVVRTGTSGSYAYPFVVRSDGYVSCSNLNVTGGVINLGGFYLDANTMSASGGSFTSGYFSGGADFTSGSFSNGNFTYGSYSGTGTFTGNSSLAGAFSGRGTLSDGSSLTSYSSGNIIYMSYGGYTAWLSAVGMQATGDGSTGQFFSDGAHVIASDKRLKQDIVTLGDDASEFIYSLNPVKYVLKGDSQGRRHHGFIAQDMQKVISDRKWNIVRSIDTEESEFLGINYTELIADMVATIQSLNERIKVLERRA